MSNFDFLVANRLEQIREKLGFSTQKAFSEKLGLKYQSYVNYEKGERNLPDEIKYKLYKMGVNISWLITGIGDMFLSPISDTNGNIIQTGHNIPLLRQKVSCGPGQAWDDESNIDRYVNVFDLIPRLKTGRVYAFTVTGSSMLGAGIKDGDIVLFDADKSQETRDGNYVFSLDGDVYCKRLEFDSLTRQIKIFSVRVADLERAELATCLKADDSDLSNRFNIFGRVLTWFNLEK